MVSTQLLTKELFKQGELSEVGFPRKQSMDSISCGRMEEIGLEKRGVGLGCGHCRDF